MLWIIWGLAIFVISDNIVYYIPAAFTGIRLANEQMVLITRILVPLTMAFAIMKHRLMDIDVLFDNALIYSITLGLLALVNYAIISLLVNLKILNFSTSQPAAILLGAWVIIFTYLALRNRVMDDIKSLLKRELYDTNIVIMDLSHHLLAASSAPQVMERVLETLYKTLRPKKVHVFLCQEGSHPFSHLPWAEEQLHGVKKSSPLKEILSENLIPKGYMRGAVAPIIGTKGLLGYFLLQEKHSERLYDNKDLKLLDTITCQSALALESLKSKEDAERSKKKANDEKERLSREVHDSLGSIMTNIRFLAEVSQRESSLTLLKQTMSTISDISKDGLADIRNFINSLDQKDMSWSALVSDIRHYGCNLMEPHRIDFKMADSLEVMEGEPSSILYLNLMRIYKEALTNILKHSQAKSVRVDLTINPKNVRLEINDDGIGLTQNGKGRGLLNMKTRTEELGGRLMVTSHHGTHIFLEIPLPLKYPD